VSELSQVCNIPLVSPSSIYLTAIIWNHIGWDMESSITINGERHLIIINQWRKAPPEHNFILKTCNRDDSRQPHQTSHVNFGWLRLHAKMNLLPYTQTLWLSFDLHDLIICYCFQKCIWLIQCPEQTGFFFLIKQDSAVKLCPTLPQH